MKNKLNKIIALCLSLILLLTIGAFAEESVALKEDGDFIEDTSADTLQTVPEYIRVETGFLRSMGIIPEDFKFEDSVTRAQMAELVIKMLNKGNLAETQTTLRYYDDVPAYTLSSGYINAATAEGLFGGKGDRIFAPDMPITFPEVAKILVSATGYGLHAGNKGGYPSGYLAVAQQTKMFKKVKSTSKDTVSWEDAIIMVYNAMQIDVIAPSVFYTNSDVIELEKQIGDNILNLNFGIYKDKGQITGTSLCKLYGVGKDDDLEVGEIEINGHLLGYDEEKLSYLKSLTGYRAEYFYRKTPMGRYEYELVYAAVDEGSAITLKSNEIFEVSGFNAGDIGSAYLKHYVDKYEREKKQLAIDKNNFSLVVNNKAVPRPTNEALFPKCGAVTLIDSNNDGKYDAASVLQYDTKIVDVVSIHDKYITFKATGNENQDKIKPLVLNSTYFNVSYEVTQDGKPLALRHLEEGDVIGILESERDDVTHYQIELLSSSMIGRVTEIGDNEVTIEGKTYGVAEGFDLADYDVALGEECELFFDYADELFYAEKTEVEYTYQYLLLGIGEKRDDRKKMQMKVVYKPHFRTGEVQILNLAEKVTLNGKRMNATALEEKLRLSAQESAKVNHNFLQPIKFIEFNENGEVKKFETENSVSTRAERKYIGDGPYNEAFDEYKLSYETQFFYIPNSMDDDDWFYGELERLTFDKSYDTLMFGGTGKFVNGVEIPEAVMIFHDQTTTNPNYGINYERPMIIDDVTVKYNKDKGEYVHSISTFNSGGAFTYESDTRNSGNQHFDELRPGDIIFSALTSTSETNVPKVNVVLGGNIWNCVVDTRLSDRSLSYYKASRTMYGRVETIETNMRLNRCTIGVYLGEDAKDPSTPGMEDGIKSFPIEGVPIYYFDRGEKNVTLGTYAAICSSEHYGEEAASNVFIWLDKENDPAMVVIVGEK